MLGLKLAAELLTRDGMAAASDQACAQQLCCLDVDADVPDLPHGNQVDIGSGMLLQQDGKGKAARKGGRKIRKAVPRPSICTAYSKSSAAALYMVADALGWKVHSTQEQNCSLYWVATKEQLEQRMLTLRAGQVVARIPGMHQFSQKCSFTQLMNLGQELFPGRFSFSPIFCAFVRKNEFSLPATLHIVPVGIKIMLVIPCAMAFLQGPSRQVLTFVTPVVVVCGVVVRCRPYHNPAPQLP